MPETKINWVTIYKALEPYEAIEVKNLLEEEGIPCRLQGDKAVQVPAKRADVAKELIEVKPDQPDL